MGGLVVKESCQKQRVFGRGYQRELKRRLDRTSAYPD